MTLDELPTATQVWMWLLHRREARFARLDWRIERTPWKKAIKKKQNPTFLSFCREEKCRKDISMRFWELKGRFQLFNHNVLTSTLHMKSSTPEKEQCWSCLHLPASSKTFNCTLEIKLSIFAAKNCYVTPLCNINRSNLSFLIGACRNAVLSCILIPPVCLIYLAPGKWNVVMGFLAELWLERLTRRCGG